jgi:hypothetical protein
MPTNATDTDSWVANVQRPNNGELADSGSLSQGFNPLTQRTRFLYNRGRSALYDITRAYGADPTGVGSSTTAIQNALNAAGAAGGHVFVPPGNFRHGLLSVPGGVSIYGVPDKSFLLHDHATANAFVFLDYQESNPVVFQDLRFLGNVATTGTHIVNNVDARVQFVRCTWNGFTSGGAPSSNLQGKLASLNSAASELEFIDCRLNVTGLLRGIDILNGTVKLTRGALAMPASYSDGLVYVGGAATVDLDGVRLDGSAHTTGTGNFVYATNGSNVRLDGCRLLGGLSVGSKSMLGWDAGARIVERGTIIGSYPAMEQYGSSAALALSSALELKHYLPAYPGPATAYTIPNGARHVALAFNGTAPTLTMPAKLFAGQRLTVSIFNDGSGGNWTGVTVIGLNFGGTNAINNNTGRSFEAVVVDRNGDGALDWVIVGSWSEMFL